MCTFIEDYLNDPSQAIQAARIRALNKRWYDQFGDRGICREIASPEFHLYEEIVMCTENENTPHQSGYAGVA